LPFESFVEFATVTADRRVNAHWNLQSGLINIPGIELNFIGRVENFQYEFTAVLDHVGADDRGGWSTCTSIRRRIGHGRTTIRGISRTAFTVLMSATSTGLGIAALTNNPPGLPGYSRQGLPMRWWIFASDDYHNCDFKGPHCGSPRLN
jgi:hypothetical protein